MRLSNYSNDISPSAFSSASFISSSQISSEIYLLAPSAALNSLTDIYPLLSSSKMSNTFLLLISSIRKLLFVLKLTNSENFIPLLCLWKIKLAKNLAFFSQVIFKNPL